MDHFEQLIEDYKRRLKTVEDFQQKFKSNGSEQDIRKQERLTTKASEYRTFIAELERACASPLKELAERIYKFLDKYAGIRPDWNPETDDADEKYTSPDAAQMKYCADVLKSGRIPLQCFSEWGGGGYKPYSSKEGREEHHSLVMEVYKIINSKKQL